MKNKKQHKKQLTVTLVRSPFGRKPGHRECVRGLGLRRIHQTVVLESTPSILGMIKKVGYLLSAKENS